ncbi:sensor histidine kinase [Hymenobacter persicinus]|uniref:histidine kinase n=1 Tax=Hymenobacter persicinus TaxID=2025506 RepID=A0A4Q5L993_9BACT|nr:ATP-binding protein [Hymenobacter persicinus]RYU77197.1 hypothetical protein EWM57_17670 [Hymenobacter persicinus]
MGPVADLPAPDSASHLTDQNRQLRQILLQSPAMIATLSGPEHRYTFTNAGYDQLNGHRARLGATVAECFPEAVGQGFIDVLDTVYRTGETWTNPEAFIALTDPATGVRQELYLSITHQALRDSQGLVTGILAFLINVTAQVQERRRADELQREVQAADARLRRLSEALPIITFTVSAEGKLSYVSPQWYAYTGQPAGGPWSEVDAAWRSQLHPDDLAPVGQELLASLAEARPMRMDLRLRGAEGHYRWFQTEIVSAWDAEGRLLLHHGYLLDVHELRETQQQLQLRDQQLSQILSQLPAGIATLVGPEHRFSYATPGYNTLAGGRVKLGYTVAELMPEVVEQGVVAWLDQVYQTGQTYQAHETLVRLLNPTTGQLDSHFLTFTYQPLHNAQQRIIGILVFVLDVTESARDRQRLDALQAQAVAAAEQLAQQAQDRERELHQMKANFVTLASHEFRTPLNTILTSTSLLEHYFSTLDAPNHHKHVQRIQASVRDLTSILNGFLHLHTLTAAPTPAGRTEINLPAFLEEVLEELSPALLPGQHIRCEASATPDPVMLDGNMLKHILVNLLSNASKYSPENADIWLLAEVSPAALRLTVRDAGIGIPPEDQEYVFNDFFRAGNAAHIQGTGLGLYMVRRYVELMHGQLEFSSELEQGSTFVVRLPLHDASL